MQNFPNSPASLPPGFTSRGGSVVGSPYPPHPSDPQISPRTTEDYAGMQQQTQLNPQSHGQHLLHRGQPHPSQATHIHSYGSRNRGAGEVSQAHSGSSSNPYRKENMDYYFSMSGRDRSRRGVAYGAGFGYSNMDGHIPHQYRHVAGSGSSSGMMSPYPLDYGSTAGSGGSSSSSSGAGSFSPSQYSMGQTPSMQSVSGPQMHQRQHSQKYPSHQALHQGQQHRAYPGLSGHRMPPQFSHYPPINASTGSAGMYSSPPQRYDGGSSGGIDSKVNNSPTHSNPNSIPSSATSNNTGPLDTMGQSYPPSGHPSYSPQAHSLLKHATQSQRNSQHSLGAGYDLSLKMQHRAPTPGLAYPKHPQSSVSSSNSAIPHLSSQEVSKSPMHSQNQQAQIHQNFSPISNPSPAPSAVQSPSCSSSSSPLMGVSEGLGNTAAPVVQPPSHNPLSNARSTHSHGRLLQTVPQLSPTPNSNSSISSCGSSAGSKAVGPNASIGGSHSALNPSRMGVGTRGGSREEGSSSLYPSCPQDKMMQDPGLNSLNALTSQVANLPNTVQHMMLTDTLLAQKRVKDGGHQAHVHHSMQQAMHATPSAQPKSRGAGAALGPSAVREESGIVGSVSNSEAEGSKGEQEEQFVGGELKRMRQMSGASSESEPTSYYPPSQNQATQGLTQAQSQTGPSCHRSNVDTGPTEASRKQPTSQSSTSSIVAQTKTPDTQTPSSLSPRSIPPSAEPSPNLPACPPILSVCSSTTSSPTHCFRSNSLLEPDVTNIDNKNGIREKKTKEIKDERRKKGDCEKTNQKWETGVPHGVDYGEQSHERDGAKKKHCIDNGEEEFSGPPNQKEGKKEGKKDKTQHFDNSNAGGVGVIVSTRSDTNRPESTKHPEVTPTSPQRGVSQHPSQLNYPEERLSVNFFRDSRSHNGEGEVSMDTYSAHYEASPKPDFGPTVPSNHPHTGSYKYGNPELPYNACMGSKNKGRLGPEGVIGTNPRYQGYHQPQSNYVSTPRKDAGVEARRGVGLGSRGQDNNSQLQQPYPSLLQEVLQGYHLDRRYGRSEQTPTAHVQSQNMVQHHYQSRLRFGLIESMRAHGMGSQTVMGGATVHHTQMATGKPHTPSQSQGTGTDLGQGLSHPSWDSEAQRTKGTPHGGPSDKSKMGASPSHSTHVQQSTDSSTGPPTKHINLADYSLPHRKPLTSLPTPPSAVQQLLLQEAEPLIGSAGSMSQTQSQKSASLLASSSERRSVICDISPSRRTTPERERERSQTGPCGASVIQQPFSSSVNEQQGCGKEDVRDKREQELEEASKAAISESANRSSDNHSGVMAKEANIPEHSKSSHPSVEVNSDLHRMSRGGKVSVDLTSTPPHHPQQISHHPSPNPLSSPSRRQSYSQGVDGSSGHASGFAGYRFGDAREGTPKLNPHNPHQPSHHPYHMLSPQAHTQNAQSTSKLQAYPHALQHSHDLDERLDWAANSNRSKEMLMLSSSTLDRHILQSQSEQRRKMQSPTDVLTNQQHMPRQQLPYPSTFYDMKMWETYSGRDGAGILEGDSCRRSQQPPSSAPESVASQSAPTAGTKNPESDVSRGVMEEVVKAFHTTPASNAVNSAGPSGGGSSNVSPGAQQGPRQIKTGGSGDTNPLMMRRRVRSFISPIPAKRQHQDFTHQRGGPSTYSPSSQNESDSGSIDAPRPKLASPNTPPNANSLSQSSSPSQTKTKSLPPRKGRGLKLEAIVQKITPNVTKVANYNSSHVDSDSNSFPGLPNAEGSHYSTDIPDQEIGAPFPRVPHGEGSCLPYLGEGHSLDDVMAYRGMEETGPLPPIAYPCDSQVLKPSATASGASASARGLQTDFDFGLGSAVSSGSVGESEKDELRIPSDFTLLGPLPPPPPLPRPVQGSPPPSSSALSDIQQFTNTYQQLETRRGEQSAANLLRQKLQETGMGFDDYAGGDYFGATSPHHGQGHHLLSRTPQHQVGSARMTGSDSKMQDSSVPKGYFASGKKKGRPVGSVNKQKRAQAQLQNLTASAASSPQTSPAATPADPQIVPTTSTTFDAPTTPDDKPCSDLVPPAQSQEVKVDAESEDTQPEMDVKPLKHRPSQGKDGCEELGMRGRQRRRRRGVSANAPKEEPETPTGVEGNLGISGIFPDNRNNVFSPYIHVERKVEEIGAVCTIINAEDEKSKGERGGGVVSGKGGSSGVDTLPHVTLSSQLVRDRDVEKVKEKRVTENVDTALLSAKALPSSEYVLPGPVVSETDHTGRLLCCLCQKWANYKNLGDLYGPFYPPEYATRLPKSHPQIRQVLANPGVGTTGLNTPSMSTESTTQDTQLLDPPNIKLSMDSDCTISHATNSTSPTTTIGTSSPATGEEMSFITAKAGSATTNKTPVQHNWDLMPELAAITEPPKQAELQNKQPQIQPPQIQQPQAEDTQQRPQHRKLTSHPRFKRRHKSSEDSPRMVPANSKASLPFQPPPPSLDSLGPLAQLAQLPQVPLDPEELWVHEGCIVWASGVYLVSGRLYGLQEALDGARDTSCSHCEMVGSTLGCYSKGCTLRYHYVCAMEADCSLNEDNFSMRCPTHKFPQSSRPEKPVYVEQSERG